MEALYTLKVLHRADLDRQIILPEACTVEVSDFELQPPPAQGQLRQIIDAITETSGDEKEIEDEVDEHIGSQVDVQDVCEKCGTKSHFGVAFSGGTLDGTRGTSEEKKEADGEGAEGMNEEIYQDIDLETDPQRKTSFKDTLITPTKCEHLRGKRITLRIEEREDLSRDILKSEACGLTIPEIDLALQPGTLGRRFTTVEDAPEQVYEEMPERTYAAEASSTMVDEDRQKFQDFLKQLKEITNAEKLPFTLIQDAPLANSYLQNLYTPDPGPNMEIVTYERT
ncbi:ZPR1 zinc-finger domain-containing protein [Pisolithus croceorrhizus]|nr:ZPR1 zinc-finger domain-containing protein [Pisolithus croceorrhizus]